MENAVHTNGPVELTLMGIEKKWVRGPKGQWRDKDKLDKPAPQIETFEEEESSKKWWKFWKR